MKIRNALMTAALGLTVVMPVAACQDNRPAHCFTEDGTYDDDLAADCPDDDIDIKAPKGKAPKGKAPAKAPAKPAKPAGGKRK